MSNAPLLFRVEAIQAGRETSLGSVRLTTGSFTAYWVTVALVFAIAAVSALFFGRFNETETADGVIVPVDGLINVIAARTGTVTKVFVQEGSSVHEGDPLVLVSAERVSSTLGDALGLTAEQLKLQKERLEANIRDGDELARRKHDDLQVQLRMLRSELLQSQKRLSIQQRQAQSARDLVAKIAPLETKGYISGIQVRQQETAAMDAELQLELLKSEILTAREKINTAEGELRSLPLSAQPERRALEDRKAQTEQTLAEIAAEREGMIRAPKDGVVTSMLVQTGYSISPTQTLLVVIPNHSLLEARLLVSSDAVSHLKIGSGVDLHYAPFPYQRFGSYHGSIAALSRSALTAQQAAEVLGHAAPDGYYRVDVALDSQSVNINGGQTPLIPGMKLEGKIRFEERRLIDFLFARKTNPNWAATAS